MDLILAFKAIIMGLVEGFTEFLPISSTGHLILAGSLLDFTNNVSKDVMDVFEIAIQAGAILAVCWEYRARIASVLSTFSTELKSRKFVLNVAIAFLPLATIGLAIGKIIKHTLFKPVPVALAFIIGGVIILLIERRARLNPVIVRVNSVDKVTPLDPLKVGCAQAFALIPGTSRSGSTIIGGMLLGLSRKKGTEFSFFLAIPTLLAATFYSLYKARDILSATDLPLFTLGTLAAFVSAFLCVRWLLRYISSHDFTFFAWCRIVFGVLVISPAPITAGLSGQNKAP